MHEAKTEVMPSLLSDLVKSLTTEFWTMSEKYFLQQEADNQSRISPQWLAPQLNLWLNITKPKKEI